MRNLIRKLFFRDDGSGKETDAPDRRVVVPPVCHGREAFNYAFIGEGLCRAFVKVSMN